MVAPITEKYEELTLEVEFDPIGEPDVFTKICGLKDVTINRTAQTDSDEVPADCDDESLPFSVVKQVRAIEVVVNATGVTSQQAHNQLLGWWNSGQPLNANITNAFVAEGEVEVESGPALLTTCNQAKTKGTVISNELVIEYVIGNLTQTIKPIP